MRPAACVEVLRVVAEGGLTEICDGNVPIPTEIEVLPLRVANGCITSVADVELPPGSQLMLTVAGVALSTFAACIDPMQAVSPSSATTALEPIFRKTDESIRGPFLFS